MLAGLEALQIQDFRCMQRVELRPSSGINVIVGENASGKTSLLEAIFFLGRGRSFRGARRGALVRDAGSSASLIGRVLAQKRQVMVGLRWERTGPIEARVGGRPATSLAELGLVLPVEAIEPEVHKLVEEGPEWRRRFMDWGSFHVEPRFLDCWRRYRRSLRQRNAALVDHSPALLDTWDEELARAGEDLAACREGFVRQLKPVMRDVSIELLGVPVDLEHRRGWSRDDGLAEALRESRDRDIRLQRTLAGPHRAELTIRLDDSAARARVSRGQQKLIAAGLMLAQMQVVQAMTGRRGVLLLDDPAAELDRRRVALLIDAVRRMDTQLFVTALDLDTLPRDLDARLFHVEHGELRRG